MHVYGEDVYTHPSKFVFQHRQRAIVEQGEVESSSLVDLAHGDHQASMEGRQRFTLQALTIRAAL
jgi:hypothetical protein